MPPITAVVLYGLKCTYPQFTQKKKKKRKRDLNLFKFKFEFKAFKIPHLLLVTYCKTWIQIWIERDLFYFF